jgi:hypothetical protein
MRVSVLLALSLPLCGQVAYVAGSGQINSTTGTSLSFNANCTGSNLAPVIAVLGNTTDTITGVTYNSNQLTQYADWLPPGYNRYLYFYSRLNAPSGSSIPVVISSSTSTFLLYAYTCYSGVFAIDGLTAGHAYTAVTPNLSGPMMVSVTTTINNAVGVSYCQFGSYNAGLAGASGTTVRVSSNNTFAQGDSGSAITPARSYSLGCTNGAAGTYIGLAMGFALAPTNGSNPARRRAISALLLFDLAELFRFPHAGVGR